MKIADALTIVKHTLSKERYEHTERVVEEAVRLADRYEVNKRQAGLAAAFHDYAKEHDHAFLKRMIISSTLPKDLLLYHRELWHGPVASLLIYDEYGIDDLLVQNAIRYHTTGKANMNKLEMIICLADYIEPGRDFPGLENVREVAEKDLKYATSLVFLNTIQFLTAKRRQVYPDTFHAYNDLIQDV